MGLPSGSRIAALELKPQRKLHFPRRRRLLELSEGQRSRQRQARVGKVHRVERIECFGAESQRLAFLQPKRFLKRQVGIEVWSQPYGRTRSAVSRQFIGKTVRGAGARED